MKFRATYEFESEDIERARINARDQAPLGSDLIRLETLEPYWRSLPLEPEAKP